MRPLNKKLWRTIWNTKGQFLAMVAVVAVGICVYIAVGTAYSNLSRSQESFYQENNFADYYFHVIRAPEQVVRQVESLPGVAQATGRIQKDVPIFKENDQRATGRLISYPLPMNGEVNRLHLLSGRLFEAYPQGGGAEVLVDSQYFAGNSLSFNDEVTIVPEGKKVSLTVVGIATSPEFVYIMKDAASMIPDPQAFGIIMLPHNQAQQILGLNGQVNQVVIKLTPGADEKKVAQQVEDLLEPYGNLASYPRRQQLSHAALQGEMDGLRTFAMVLPVIFLGVAAGVQFVMLGRMVRAQRMSIGVMKAIGYSNWQIMLHYSGYAVSMSFSGALVGTVLGLMLASVISQLYAQFFNLPQSIGGINIQTILYGFLLSLGVGGAAGLTATRGITRMKPSDSMRPEPPRRSSRTLVERWGGFWRRLTPSWKMGIRSIARNRGRFGVTLVGVVFAVGLLVISIMPNNTFDYMIEQQFFKLQKYDYLVRFTAPVKDNELLDISRLDGVIRTEPILEVPVKLHFAGREEEDLMLGLSPGTTMRQIESDTGQSIHIPEEGMLINILTANKLGVRVGDQVEVETLLNIGPVHRSIMKVVGVNQQMIGGGSYVSLEQANRVLQEKGVATGAMLKVDPGQGQTLEDRLNQMTGVASVLSRQNELEGFTQYLDMILATVAMMVGFAMVLGWAIIYNSSVVSFAERKRELASLRVLGYTTQEVAGLLSKEALLLTLVGLLVGLPFGRLMADAYIKSVSTELFTMPVIIYPLTYALSALGGVFFIVTAHRFGVRGLKHLDMVEVFKNREQ